MTQESAKSDIFLNRTCWGYVSTRVLDTPFWAIYNMLPFILYKDLHATPLQLAAVITLKPLSSLFSMYWSASIDKRQDRLVSNIIWARVLGYLPFFLFPFISNPWFFIAAFGFYMTLTLGIVPAWMEILKQNIPSVMRERVFSYTQAFGYMGGGLLPFILGWLLDSHYQAWRWIFPLAATLSLTALLFQARIRIKPQDKQNSAPPPATLDVLNYLIKPWKNAWQLIRKHPDFLKFQIGFMLVGSGLMIIQPILPVFFVDVLNLSYTELALAITLCKGIGFALGSPLWAKWINRIDIYRFSSWITALGCLFPLFLILAKFHIAWLYVAYLSYGFMQSGNELNWNMSGPIFARDEDSSVFTSVNVLAVGLRGCFVPALGTFFCYLSNSVVVMLIGALLCMLATWRLALYGKALKGQSAGENPEFRIQNSE